MRNIARRDFDGEPVVRAVAVLLHQLAGLGAIGRDIRTIARQGRENLGRQPLQPGGRCLHCAVYVALSLGEDVEKALAVDRQLHRPSDVGVVKRRCIPVDEQVLRRLRFFGRRDKLKADRSKEA